ncbi:alpha/beta fold hydrolase [Phaeobacter sp. PT47_59]|uniref:alpha/beta fold hydrolase n=1 Tax=Phaeobacter sp. PT47_59 TaxID=3029979 RepID=UPI0023801E29|nr:alpha/beta fold hydrolase [Phaeobacter sp. PT47_59]MDE4173233.1 alpha/beta fold hydrolase [Phaeobacter sp. PT47_59]
MPVLNAISLAALALPAALLGATHLSTRRMAREAEALVPPVGQFHQTPHGRLHYVEMGQPDAQPLVLIHGLAGQLQHFTYALAHRLATDFRVIALDRPGCGYSTRNSDTLARLPAQAEMIQNLLDAKGIKNPVLVGHSLGGAVSLAMALAAPENVRGLALLAPVTHSVAGGPDVFKGLIVNSPMMRRLMANTVAIPAAKRTAETMLTQIFAPEACPDDFLDRAGGVLGLRPQSFITASADATMIDQAITEQARRYARDLRTPGGVLFGADDTVLNAKEQGRSMEAYGLRCRIEPGLGHMLPITQPALCEEFIRSTVASLPK